MASRNENIIKAPAAGAGIGGIDDNFAQLPCWRDPSIAAQELQRYGNHACELLPMVFRISQLMRSAAASC